MNVLVHMNDCLAQVSRFTVQFYGHHKFPDFLPFRWQIINLPTISRLPNKFHGHFATPLEYVISLIHNSLYTVCVIQVLTSDAGEDAECHAVNRAQVYIVTTHFTLYVLYRC